jgi:hypothetical protein
MLDCDWSSDVCSSDLLDGDSPAKEALLALGDRVAEAAQTSLEAASTVHR